MKTFEVLLFIAALFISMGMGYSWGWQAKHKDMQIQCVKEGRAYWEANPDGTTRFVWKTP